MSLGEYNKLFDKIRKYENEIEELKESEDLEYKAVKYFSDELETLKGFVKERGLMNEYYEWRYEGSDDLSIA